MASPALAWTPRAVTAIRVRRSLRLFAVLSTLVSGTARLGSHAGQVLGVTIRAVRPYSLPIGGLASFSVAAFQLSEMAGWAVLGLGFFVLDWLRRDS